MFRILLEQAPGVWGIVQQDILLGADAIRFARAESTTQKRAYRIEEYSDALPEAKEKKHYLMLADVGHLQAQVKPIGK